MKTNINKTWKRCVCAASTTIITLAVSHAHAQESPLQWSFSQDNSARSATLRYHVPETDNIQAYAFCDNREVPNGARVMLSTEINPAQTNGQAKARISGGGQEHEFNARIAIPASGEGIVGVRMDISNNHSVWQLFNQSSQFSVQVPGYSANTFPLVGGQSAIADFLNACKSFSAGSAQTASNNGNGSNRSGNSSGGLTEKEAFNAAKELDSPEAWQAFLRVYPQGFFAELARGYLAKQNQQIAAPAKPAPSQPAAPSTPNVQPVNIQRATTPWYNFNYQQDEGNASSYAAGVRAGGAEFFAWCSPNRMINFGMRSTGTARATFDNAVQAAANSGNPMNFSFQNGAVQNVPMQVFGLTGEVGFSQQQPAGGAFVERLMRDSVFNMQNQFFSAAFQLKGSRAALCDVINRCGAIVARCQKPVAQPLVATPRAQNPKAKKPRVACRSRSVYVEGRGCILKKYVNKGPRKNKNGCRRGQRRLEGQCMYPAQMAGFCGPGYRPSRGKCVPRTNPRPKPRRKMLKRNEGGFISLAACRRRGMIAEFGYCVEND